jgi:FixJ family two-component response regulator
LINDLQISIVDDDKSFRESLKSLIHLAGFKVEAFASAEEILNSKFLGETDCLIVDFRMPGMNGLELQRRLVASRYLIPVVFVSAHGNEEIRSLAIKEGAIDFLYKPFSEDVLMKAIYTAIRRRNHSGLVESEE